MQRTVLIGLDGATFTVLDPLMSAGVMPRLREFLAAGVRAELISTPNPLTPPAWTSLVTGRTPGHHGIFDFIRAAEGEGGLYFTLNTSGDVRCETIWSIVSRQRGTVTALNFPVSTPPLPVDGHVVPGFVPWRHLRRSVHPPELYAEMRSIPGFDARVLSMDMNEELRSIQWLPDEEYEPWIVRHIERERQWFGVLRAIVRKRTTDLIAVLFDGVDKLQHLCWRHIDPSLAPSSPTPLQAAIRRRCLAYFEELDRLIGEVIALAGPEARVFFASDHGFGPSSEIFYANVWLEREGYLSWSPEASKDEALRMAADRIKSHVIGIDWSRTRAYALTPSSNGIFIRRADGPGRPGVRPDQYEPFRRELVDRLLAFAHPRTGRRIVRRAMTREEAFPGAASSGAPDITLVLEDHGFLSVLNADAMLKERPEPAGTHRPEGVFMAGGPGVARGRSIGPLAITDVAPALLYSLGLPVPADLEGRVPVECFEERFVEARPPVIGRPTTASDAARDEDARARMSEQDEAIVMERLRSLGYIE